MGSAVSTEITVGDELLREIERVAAKRERWKQYQREADERTKQGSNPVNFHFAILFMTVALDNARAAIASNDVIDCIACLRALQEEKDENG